MVALAGAAIEAWAKNNLNNLDLRPEATVVAIFGDDRVLASQGNQKIFRSAGFETVTIVPCADKVDMVCLSNRLDGVRKQAAGKAIVLVASIIHTQTVYSIYRSERIGHDVAGIVLFRARRDIEAFPPNRSLRGPPLLVIAKDVDDTDVVRASRRFADRLHQAGIWSWFVLLPPIRPTAQAPSPVVRLITYFLGGLDSKDAAHEAFEGSALWQHPPLNNNGFHAHSEFIATYPVDNVFRRDVAELFLSARWQTKQWEFETFRALDLIAYRDSNPSTKGLRYLVLKNRTGQFLSVDLDEYRAHKPVVVVGIDEETNLFRISWFYRTKAAYSWIKQDRPPQISVEPMGAFLQFRKPLPKQLRIPFAIRSKLDLGSLHFTDSDPLAPLDGLPSRLREIIVHANNCINCHELDGLGGRAHHLISNTGKEQPGIALPLRSYSRVVLQNFFFNQREVAARIGVSPNLIRADDARAMLDFLTGQKD
ncbi:MAG: hypothetical protein ACR2PA_16350 [Hyphomicrobiaceae bacterium]